jgi:beta-lactamase superfamily II metal-dependent hydrolase
MAIKDKKKLARVIATWVVTAVMLSVFILDIAVVALSNKYVNETPISTQLPTAENGDDRIHFLNTANSDCIIIESNGRFALVDSGEGNNNPRRKTEYKGYEKEVLSYIKEHCLTENGEIHLDFIVATHMHYDHSGNFEPILKDTKIKIDKAFIKEYDNAQTTKMDSEYWGNHETYEKIISALKEREITIISDIPAEAFVFGDFTLQFINTSTNEFTEKAGENANSIGIKLTKGNKKAFLAADFTNDAGFETAFAKQIGNIDLLKIGHHGYFGSSSTEFLKVLTPDIAICTNYLGKIYPNVKWNLTMVAKTPVFSTAHRNGIIATFTDNNEILLTENIM